MSDLNETRKNLELSLGEDLKKQYFALLKRWFLFKGSISKVQFDNGVRKLMINEEQVRNHNLFMLALYAKVNSVRVKGSRNSSDKGSFELADYTEYMAPSSPTITPPTEFENRNAASELFMPDSGFIATRIAVHAWENGLEGADKGVTEVVVNACQVFVKNIITAMISRKEGYKVRDNKLQYGFGLSVPDPFVRNTSNIIDSTQESKVEVSNDDDSFIPACRSSLENIEQQTAFAYSCGKQNPSDGKLTVKLLYDTLKEDPSIVGLHSIHSVNLLKLGLQLEDPC